MATIILAILFLSAFDIARSDPLFSLCSASNFTANSTYHANLNSLLSTLVSDTNGEDSGFYNVSYGQNSDKVNAVGFCRADTSDDACHKCITNATSELKQRCPNQKEAIIWHEECTLRYANRTLFGTMDTQPAIQMTNPANASNTNQFIQSVTTLLDGLKAPAASGDSLKFATGSANVSDSETVYGFMQCSPDLTETECNDCLSTATGMFQQCCAGKIGGRLLTPSCNFRYENYIFFNVSDDELSPSQPPAYSPMLPPLAPVVPTPSESTASPAPLSNTATRNGIVGNRFQILVLLVASLISRFCL